MDIMKKIAVLVSGGGTNLQALIDASEKGILKSGEIEDILPKNLILRTLNDYFVNLNSIDDTEFEDSRMVKNLEEIFKKKGFHEFKKSEFANLIKSHIKSKDDISAEVKMIIDELSSGLL